MIIRKTNIGFRRFYLSVGSEKINEDNSKLRVRVARAQISNADCWHHCIGLDLKSPIRERQKTKWSIVHVGTSIKIPSQGKFSVF